MKKIWNWSINSSGISIIPLNNAFEKDIRNMVMKYWKKANEQYYYTTQYQLKGKYCDKTSLDEVIKKVAIKHNISTDVSTSNHANKLLIAYYKSLMI